MINIRIVCVGNLKESYWREAEGEYKKRLSKFCKLEIVELDEKNKFDIIDKIKDAESEEIMASLTGKSILLDLNGKQISSEEFSEKLDKLSLTESTITFVIGGSYGVNQSVKTKIEDKISFGRVTYPHNIARVLLLEQIYRAFMILSGSKYHK